MKKSILVLLLISSFSSRSQTLKDLLYKGKLKSDTGSVVKKTDDLSAKIDTSAKKPAEPEKLRVGTAVDSSIKGMKVPVDSPAVQPVVKTEIKASPKDNTKIWKEYMDSVISSLKTEVMSSKKIKNGNYFVIIDYEIGIDGQVTINSVSPYPENSFLQQQVKERLTLSAPQLNPVLDANGKPRKISKKYNFNIAKQ